MQTEYRNGLRQMEGQDYLISTSGDAPADGINWTDDDLMLCDGE